MNSKNSLVNFNSYITHTKTSDYLSSVLGSKKEAFVSNVVSLVSNNVDLQACTPATIMYSSIKATTLGLPLDNNLGFAYVLPYKNNNKGGIQEAQFQLGYKGFIQLAYRSGQFQTLNVQEIREGEILDKNLLTGEITFKEADNRESLPVIGYVSFFRLNNGFEKSLYMTVEELKAHGQEYSKSYNSKYSNWKKRFKAMAEKTVIKLLLSKYAPLSIEMQKDEKLQEALKFDQAVIRSEDEFQYIDNDQTQDVDYTEIQDEEEKQRALDFLNKVETPEELKELIDSLGSDLCEKLSKEIDAKGQEVYGSQIQKELK